MRRHYKKRSSGFAEWPQKANSEDFLIFPENIGEYLSIDELSLSHGELYTFVTNKSGKGKQGTLVASIKGTLTKSIVSVLDKISLAKRRTVKEVTLDMANNMESAVIQSFPLARLVTDRFHVVRLATDAVQHIRIKIRWDELDKENNAIEEAKKSGVKYKTEVLANGDTPKQLLARSRYLLMKKSCFWTQSQKDRAALLFNRYPILKDAYEHTIEFRNIYESKDIEIAHTKFTKWLEKTKVLNIKEFNTVANTITNNFDNILNFFYNRNTNANAESFNAKVKLFRANLRGVIDNSFFLFRISKLFA